MLVTSAGQQDSRPVAILLVEDEVLIRMIAADVLVEAGFRVVEAGDAHEALTILEARADARVVVTDVNMPGKLDGFGFARLISLRWPHIGIIVTSGHAHPDDGDLPKGSLFLSKPYQPSALLHAVRELAGGPAAVDTAVDPAAAIVMPADGAANEVLQAAPLSTATEHRTSEKDSEAEEG